MNSFPEDIQTQCLAEKEKVFNAPAASSFGNGEILPVREMVPEYRVSGTPQKIKNDSSELLENGTGEGS